MQKERTATSRLERQVFTEYCATQHLSYSAAMADIPGDLDALKAALAVALAQNAGDKALIAAQKLEIAKLTSGGDVLLFP